MAGLSCSGQPVQKVRLDFGWEGALAGEGIEGVEMEWNALCYDITVCPAIQHAMQYAIQHAIKHMFHDLGNST